MNDAAARDRTMTLTEFLVWRQGREGHHELVDGTVVTSLAGSPRHGLAAALIGQQLAAALAEGPCRVYTQGVSLLAGSSLREPDVFVACGPVGEGYEDDAVAAVEVLSPESYVRDVQDKRRDYLKVPSLQQYLVVDPDQATATLHTRHDLGWYVSDVEGTFPFAGAHLDLAAVHEAVDRKLPPSAPR